MLERAPLVRLAEDRATRLVSPPGFWACMDTQRDLDHLNQLWASGEAPWTIPLRNAGAEESKPRAAQVREMITGLR